MSEPVAQAQEEAMDVVESESSSELSDEDEELETPPAGTEKDEAPADKPIETTEPKKDQKKKKDDSTKSKSMVFDLGSARTRNAELFRKTDINNILKSLGQLPVNDTSAASRVLADLDENGAKTAPKHAYLTIDNGGISALNFVMNLVHDAIAERANTMISLKGSATLTDVIFDQTIDATFSQAFVELFFEEMNRASDAYHSQDVPKEPTPTEVPANA